MTGGSPYRYWIADTLGGELRGEPRLSEVSFSYSFNGVGTLTAKAPARHPDTAKLLPVLRSLYVTRGSRCVWSGVLWTAQQSPGSREVELGAAEFGSLFERRKLRINRSYSATSKPDIAADLVEYAQSVHPDADYGIATTVEGSAPSDVVRNYLGADRSTFLDLLTSLANTRDGFSFEFVTDLVGGTFERRFVARYPQTRRIGLRIDSRLYASSPGVSVDGTAFARAYEALGEGEGDGRPVANVVDSTLAGEWPYLEETETFSTVSQFSTLDEYARSRLARSRTLRSVPTIPLLTGPGAELGSYRPGDEVRVDLDLDWISYTGWQRIASMKVTPAGARETVEVAFVDPTNFEEA